MNESRHINLDAARSPEQERQYAAISEAGVCPFCPEHYGQFEFQDPPVHESEHWYTINNMKRYGYTQHHKVIIAKQHVLFPDELTPEAWLDLQENLAHFRRVLKLGYAAVGMRIGDPAETGASVGHLHAHLVQPDPAQTGPNKSVVFYMSRNYGEPKS